MDPFLEMLLHNKHVKLVSPPPPETMRKSLADFAHLDRLGASALGRRIALVPESLEDLVPGVGLPKNRANFSPLEQAKFFDGEMERALRILEEPLVTPQRVVTGAISRMARMLNSERLLEEAKRRAEIDPIYYPVRIRSAQDLYTLSNTMFSTMCTVEKISKNKRRRGNSLQTEVDDIKLAA
jgi:hypothetical protein